MQIGLSVSCWTSVIGLGEQLGLVGHRHAHVDVEHVGAALDLGDHVALDRGQVPGAQLLLEDPAARRVDPLADQAEAAAVPEDHLGAGAAQGGLVPGCGGAHAVTRARFFWSRSLARLTVCGRVRRVAVGADRVGVLLGDRRAADHHDDLVAQAGLLQRVEVGLEHRHRRGEERREADDVGLVLDDLLHELLRGHLHAEVDDLEAGALEHDVDEVLADVVDVALDGAHQELADGLHAGVGEQRAQHLHGAGHRAAGDQHLRDEEVAALEAGADLLQGRDQRVEEQALRLHVRARAPGGSGRGPRVRCPSASRRTAAEGSPLVSCRALL